MTNAWLLKRFAVAVAIAGFIGGVIGYLTYEEEEATIPFPSPEAA